MASSAFSFHCMICFEEFDPETNYPVVLPCGHTYVCVACANRLDKCMECRTPLTVTVKVEPTPHPTQGGAPATPGPNRAHSAASGSRARFSRPDVQKENVSCYADRVRNSPGFRRRYGYQYQYNNNNSSSSSNNNNNNNNKRGSPQLGASAPATPQPQPAVKQRLPLPKNAVLLSLIQASEPARRRAEVEAPPTPHKTVEVAGADAVAPGTRRSGTPSPGTGSPSNDVPISSAGGLLPKFSRPSPLFLDGSSGDPHSGKDTSPSNLVGSVPDDEEHKIRVGTYLEGGPCGTYAVAAKGGLLVYPTLFEHALPSGLNGMRQEEEDGDVMKRDVEELVKKHRANIGMRTFPGNEGEAPEIKGLPGVGNTKRGKENNGFDSDGSPIATDTKTLRSSGDSVSPVDTELGVSRTWVECHEDECTVEIIGSGGGLGRSGDSGSGGPSPVKVLSPLPSPMGAGIPMMDGLTTNAAGGAGDDAAFGGRKPPASLLNDYREFNDGADDGEVRGLSVSLTVSSDDETSDEDADVVDMSTRTLPCHRSQSFTGLVVNKSPLHLAKDDSCFSDVGGPVGKKFVRHFSKGSYPKQKQKMSKDRDPSRKDKKAVVDEFDRPLIRLKYGDRVQVVSMDSRGWVKLARGYGYIRLENDKQLVKVGGTSDKACQIEAMLHELSIERNRLKHKQTKLERLSAGLMIDLQSSLITSDDHVIVSAPEGSLRRSDSELSTTSLVRTGCRLDTSKPKISLADIDVSTSSGTILSPSRSKNEQNQSVAQESNLAHREIRTAKSHSPARASSLGRTAANLPPSPPYGQVTGNLQGSQHNWSSVNTPTRVNFRTGLSGHRALTSSHSHPHDFIEIRGIRSMSNHSGISSSKKTSNTTRGRSIY